MIQQSLTINPTTGATSGFTNLPFFDTSGLVDYSAMAFNSSGTSYLLDTASISAFGYLVSSAASPLGLSSALGSEAGMTFDSANEMLYVADGGTGGTDDLYILNPATGVLTTVGNLGLANGLAGLAFTPAPEPGTSVLIGAGLVFVVALGRRWRRVPNFSAYFPRGSSTVR